MSLADAIIAGDLQHVQAYIDHGTDLNAPDEYGYYPIVECAIANSTEIARLLLQHNVDVDQADSTGRTALFWAVENNNLELAELLLQYKANPNRYSIASQPILVNALLKNSKTMKQLLYQHKVDVNFALDFINTKLLGHRYHLPGQIDIVDSEGYFVELDFEGFFLEFSLDILNASLQQYRNHYAARSWRDQFSRFSKIIFAFQIASQLMHYQHYLIDIRQHTAEIATLLQASELLIIPICYDGHAITLVKLGNNLAYCDRGEYGKQHGSVTIHRIGNIKAINHQLIQRLIYEKSTTQYIRSGLRYELALEPLYQLPIEPQTVGNCAWANIEAAIPAALFMLLQKVPTQSVKADIAKAMRFFTDWGNWDKRRALDECLASFTSATATRKASKAALLATIIFHNFSADDPIDQAQAHKILPVIHTSGYEYVVKSFMKVFYQREMTDKGRNFRKLLELCDIPY